MSTLSCSLLLWMFATATVAQAATAQVDPNATSFAVGPMKIEVVAAAGSQGRGSFTLLLRNSTVPTQFRIEVQDLGQLGGGRTTPVEPGTGARSCRPWLQVAQELLVPPNGRVEVPVVLDFPADAKGAYFALVTVRLETEAAVSPIRVALNPAVSVLVEASVPGAAPAHVDLTAVGLPQSGNANDLIVATLSNRGVWKSTVEGDLLIYPAAGGFPLRAQLPRQRGEQSMNIYPGLSYSIRVPLPRPLTTGNYRVVGRLLLNGRWRTENEFELEVTSGGEVMVRHVGDSEFDIPLFTQPDLIELPVPPGATRTVPLRISSSDLRPLDLELEVAELRMEPSGQATFPDPRPDQIHWVQVTPKRLDMLPRRVSTARITISVPRDMPPGTMVVRAVRLKASAESAEPGWSSAGEGVILVVAVDPRAPQAQLELDPIVLVRPADDRNPTAALIRVRNIGGRVARLQGEIILVQLPGHLAARLQVGADHPEILLPGDVRELHFTVPIVGEGRYQVQARLRHAKDVKPVLAEVPFESKIALPVGLEAQDGVGPK
jgi:hypothetical protein